MSNKDQASSTRHAFQYVGPYRLEKTLGKGQTGTWLSFKPFGKIAEHTSKQTPNPTPMQQTEEITARVTVQRTAGTADGQLVHWPIDWLVDVREVGPPRLSVSLAQ